MAKSSTLPAEMAVKRTPGGIDTAVGVLPRIALPFPNMLPQAQADPTTFVVGLALTGAANAKKRLTVMAKLTSTLRMRGQLRAYTTTCLRSASRSSGNEPAILARITTSGRWTEWSPADVLADVLAGHITYPAPGRGQEIWGLETPHPPRHRP